MLSLNGTVLGSNTYMKINFDGGDLSSATGLPLVKGFACKLSFDQILRFGFKNYTKLHNGAETVPANIQRNYHLSDTLWKTAGQILFRFK